MLLSNTASKPYKSIPLQSFEEKQETDIAYEAASSERSGKSAANANQSTDAVGSSDKCFVFANATTGQPYENVGRKRQHNAPSATH